VVAEYKSDNNRGGDIFVAENLTQVLADAGVEWHISENRLHGHRGCRAAKWKLHDSDPWAKVVSYDGMASNRQWLFLRRVGRPPAWGGTTLVSSLSHLGREELSNLAPFRHVLRKSTVRPQPDLAVSHRELPGQNPMHCQVTEEVVHPDSAVQLDADVAASQVQSEEDERYAQLVERRVLGASVPQSPQRNDTNPATVSFNILSYRSGKGELFRKMLLEDAEFKSLRDQLGSRGLRPDLPCGALILIHPEHYHAVLYNVAGRELKRYNLIIAASDDYLVDEVLQRLSSKQRPRDNHQERHRVEFLADFVTKRTFLCTVPTMSIASTVAQSTTEAQRSSGASSSNYYAHARGGNPRRLLG